MQMAQLLRQGPVNSIGGGINQAAQAVAMALMQRRANQQQQKQQQGLITALQGSLSPEQQQQLGPLLQNPQAAPAVAQALLQQRTAQAFPDPNRERAFELEERALDLREEGQEADQAFRQRQLGMQQQEMGLRQQQMQQQLQLAKMEQAGAIQEANIDRVELTGDLRKSLESTDQVKMMVKAMPAIRAANQTIGRDTLASDLNLVFAVGKTFDPESVVREGEQVAVANSQSIPGRIMGYINAVNGGSRLSAEARQNLLQELNTRANILIDEAQKAAAPFVQDAIDAGLDPARVARPTLFDRERLGIPETQGQPEPERASSFRGAIPSAEAGPTAAEPATEQRNFRTMDNATFLGQDISQMSPEQREEYARELERRGF